MLEVNAVSLSELEQPPVAPWHSHSTWVVPPG